MDKEEYKKRKAEMEARHEQEKKDLAIAYAKANNPYKVGDILTDGRGRTIQVDRICYSRGTTWGGYSEFPFCIYEGAVLKKDLTPRKASPFRDSISQPHVKEKLTPKES